MKTVTIDRVCGMKVDERPQLRAEHDGVLCLFAAKGCRTRFLEDPDDFVNHEKGDAREGASEVQRRQKGRGARTAETG